MAGKQDAPAAVASLFIGLGCSCCATASGDLWIL